MRRSIVLPFAAALAVAAIGFSGPLEPASFGRGATSIPTLQHSFESISVSRALGNISPEPGAPAVPQKFKAGYVEFED